MKRKPLKLKRAKNQAPYSAEEVSRIAERGIKRGPPKPATPRLAKGEE